MLKKLLELEQKFLGIYERAKKKEEELEGKTEHHTQRPFYFIKSIDRKGETSIGRFRIRASKQQFSLLLKSIDAVQETEKY